MDERLVQTAKKQYERVFSTPQALSNVSSPQSSEDTFITILNNASLYIMGCEIGDEDFDAIAMTAEEIDGCQPEDLLTMINLKLKRLIEVLSTEELVYKTVEVENDQLKEVLSEKMKQTEGVVAKLKQEVESLLNKNVNALQKQKNAQNGHQRVEDEIQKKDDNILQLNKNIKQMMDDYLIKREQSEALDIRLNSLRQLSNKLRSELQEAAAQASERQQMIDEKERECENMKREYNNMLKVIGKNEKKVTEFGGSYDKKVEENDRHQSEYSKLLEKNANHVKAIQEIEKEIIETKESIETKNKELAYVRNLNKIYEEKSTILPELEKKAYHEDVTNARLEEEHHILIQQIKDLAPHSVVDDQQNDLVTKEIQTNADLEKYADMKPEDILNELDKYRRIAAHTNQKVATLEAKNTRLVTEINQNKYNITDLKSDLSEKSSELDRIKEDREEIASRAVNLEKEIQVLLTQFTKLSGIIENRQIKDEADPNYKFSFNEDKGEDYVAETQNHTPIKPQKTKAGVSSGKNTGSKKK